MDGENIAVVYSSWDFLDLFYVRTSEPHKQNVFSSYFMKSF